MKSYSIEYFHIYTDEQITEEHTNSIAIMKDIATKLAEKADEESVSKVVMIDNYNPQYHLFDKSYIQEYLSNKNAAPDIIIYEADLYTSALELMTYLTPRVYNEYNKLINKLGKLPCSLFIATLMLIRMGELKCDHYPKNQSAYKLINILPSKYSYVERKAIKIILASPFKSKVDDIYHIFYDDPRDGNNRLDHLASNSPEHSLGFLNTIQG